MEQLGERIKSVRKAMGLTMEEFGKKLGMTKASVSRIENGINGPSEQTVRLICSTFGVDYTWLTQGTGEMFVDDMDFVIDELAAKNHWDDETKEILKKLYKLPPDKQELVLKLIESMKDEGK